MARKNKQAEVSNNTHECREKKIALNRQNNIALKDISLSPDKINMIWDFYVSHAPILNDQKEKGNGFGYRYLGDIGWGGSVKLFELEKELIKAAGLGCFVIIKADTITETLKNMNLNDTICWKHPRAVLKQRYKIKVRETGKIDITNSESRMVCLFRHIRNSLAHNRIYLSQDRTMILLEDAEDGGRLSARILIPVHSLVEWIKIVDRNKNFYFKPQDGTTGVISYPA